MSRAGPRTEPAVAVGLGHDSIAARQVVDKEADLDPEQVGAGGGPGPRALARLALSDRARELVDDAMLCVPTLDDRDGSAGELLAQALRVRTRAGTVVGAAIRNARAQGMDWEEIARYCGIRVSSVVERWEPEEQLWHEILRHAADPDAPRSEDPDDPRDIPLVHEPEAYAADLDSWAAVHLDPFALQRWREEGKDPAHPVSGGLPEA